jgi:hypothetical protein
MMDLLYLPFSFVTVWHHASFISSLAFTCSHQTEGRLLSPLSETPSLGCLQEREAIHKCYCILRLGYLWHNRYRGIQIVNQAQTRRLCERVQSAVQVEFSSAIPLLLHATLPQRVCSPISPTRLPCFRRKQKQAGL